MNQLRNFIFEEINEYFIEETYKSVNEIKQLASDIIRSIAENNIDRIKEKGHMNFLFGTYLNAIDHNKYDEIASFIKNANIAITIDQPHRKGAKGAYVHTPDVPYDPKQEHEIEIYIDDLDNIFERINEKLEERGEKYNDHDLYMDLFYPLYSSLIHELQHAYDDYRSKGKAYQTKEFKKYRQKYLKNAVTDQVESDIEQALRYVNLPHEIWARFSQAMHRIHFTDMDFEGNKVIFKMRPIRDVVKDFKNNFDHYRELKDSMKKKLVKKVAQFWHYEQDHLDEKIEKANKRR